MAKTNSRMRYTKPKCSQWINRLTNSQRSVLLTHLSLILFAFFLILLRLYRGGTLASPPSGSLSLSLPSRNSAAVHGETNGNQVRCQSHSVVSCSAQQPLSRCALEDNRVSYTSASRPRAYLTPFALCTLHLTPNRCGFHARR